jgi:ATP-binding cassette subfamily B protein
VQEETVLEKFKEHNQDAATKSYNAGRYSTIVGPSVNFINNLTTVLVGTGGGVLFVMGMIALGPLAGFMLYSKRFSGPINQMTNLMADIQSALAAAERVFHVLDCEDERLPVISDLYEGINQGQIEFKDVSFGYKEDQLVLKNVNFTARSGKVVAIVGPTGAGKTTLVNLLMRFYNVNDGEILIDGTRIDDFDNKYYRSKFSMVLQDTWLFKGTIYDNIRYGHDDVTLDDVKIAAKKAKIHHYIKGLPQGYDTIMSDDGVNISKGQKQLLIIARAMLSKATVLILDEATSNVDTYTEVLIQEAMTNLMKEKTCFIIAHRLSTIKTADLILLMKQGNIVEQGTHSELMEQEGQYFELFMSQFN